MEKMNKEGIRSKVISTVSAKPVLGKPLGAMKMLFRYGDGTIIELEGDVSDVTGLFVSRKVQAEFKSIIYEEVDFLQQQINSLKSVPKPVVDVAPVESTEKKGKKKNSDSETETTLAIPEVSEPEILSQEERKRMDIQENNLKKAVEAFKTFRFDKACRVLLLEEFISHQQHLIVQAVYLDVLVDYAYTIDQSQWSLLRGLKYDYIVDGRTSTFPHRQFVKDLGEVFIHIFVPDLHDIETRLEKEVDVDYADIIKALEVMGDIVSVIPQTVDVKKWLDAKDRELRSKEDTLSKMEYELAEKSTYNDSAGMAVSSHETENENPRLMPSKIDIIDTALISLPTVLFALIGFSMHPLGWLGGLAIGLPLGFAFSSRRK